MKKQLLIFPFIIFFFILLVFFYLLLIERNPEDIPSAMIEKKVPVFTTTSLLFNNKKFLSKEEFGKQTTIVNFFATWCKPCRDEHNYIKRLANDEELLIIGINYKDKTENAVNWLKELGNPYSNIAIDSNGIIGIDWGINGIPETFIVNSNGIIKYRHIGPITEKKYDDFYTKVKEIKK